MRSCVLAAVAAASSLGLANANIMYTEGADLSDDFLNATDLGSLGEGVNRIAGSLSSSCVANPSGTFADCTGGDEADFFVNTIDPGLVFVSASLTVSNLTFDGNLLNLGIVRPLTPGGTDSFFFDQPDFTVDPLVLDGLVLSSFGIETQSATITSPVFEQGLGSYSLDYELEIIMAADSVDAIPVPGALVLMATGAAGLIGRRKISRA